MQHERAPRGALKRSFQPEGDTMQTHTAPALLPLNHPPPLTSLSAGYSFYAGHFPFPWRPALGLHHVPRHFAMNILAPGPLPVTLDDPALLNRVKEDEVSSSAVEEQPAYKRRNLGKAFQIVV